MKRWMGGKNSKLSRLRNCLCYWLFPIEFHFSNDRNRLLLCGFLIKIHEVKVFNENNLIILVYLCGDILLTAAKCERLTSLRHDIIFDRLCSERANVRVRIMHLCVVFGTIAQVWHSQWNALLTIKRSMVRSITPFFNMPLSIMSFIMRLKSLQPLINLYICSRENV